MSMVWTAEFARNRVTALLAVETAENKTYTKLRIGKRRVGPSACHSTILISLVLPAL